MSASPTNATASAHLRRRRDAIGASARSATPLGAGICENITVVPLPLLIVRLENGAVEVSPKNRGCSRQPAAQARSLGRRRMIRN